MNASKQKKTEIVEKTLKFQRKKKISFELFEIVEKLTTGPFLITITQLKKSGSIDKIFIPLEI